MSERRDVRVSATFFEDLDRQLGQERGPDGQPSTIDFQSIELIPIIDRSAEDFDAIPVLFEGRSDYRVLVKSGILVRALEIVGVQASDGAIELISLELDLRMEWD